MGGYCTVSYHRSSEVGKMGSNRSRLDPGGVSVARVASVLVQREVESGRSPLSEYNAHFREPVWEDISQRTGGWWTGRRLKLQLVSKKGKHVGWSAFTRPGAPALDASS